jgi:hypothetical protein
MLAILMFLVKLKLVANAKLHVLMEVLSIESINAQEHHLIQVQLMQLKKKSL